MNKTISNLLVFAAGAAIGSLITWKLTSIRYEKKIQQEVDDIRDYYRGGYVGPEGADEAATDVTDEERALYNRVVTDLGYTSTTEEKEEENNDGGETVEKPYVISPDEFGQFSDYATVSLTYYSDGVVAYEDDQVLTNSEIDESIGVDSLRHFGDFDYDPDTVYVRNDSKMIDYEIHRDLDPFPGV